MPTNSAPVLNQGGMLSGHFYNQPAGSADTMLLRPDGTLVVAGVGVLQRYLPDGQLDRSFGEAGQAPHQEPFPVASLNLADGGFIVAGQGFTKAENNFDIYLARYLADGRLDSSFGNAGVIHTDVGPGTRDKVMGIAQLADGRILLAGSAANVQDGAARGFLAAYLPDGRLDSTFGQRGIAILPEHEVLQISVQADGKIVALANGQSGKFGVFRFNQNGSLDTGFGHGGSSEVGDFMQAIALQPDGKIVLAGFAGIPNAADGINSALALTRLNPDGSLDRSFGEQGRTLRSINDWADRLHTGSTVSISNELSQVAILPNGAIVAAGTEKWHTATELGFFNETRFVAMRLDANGKPDHSFGTEGVAGVDLPPHSQGQLNEMLIRPDGSLILGGNAHTDGGFSGTSYYQLAVAQFRPDGSLDGAFAAANHESRIDYTQGFPGQVLNQGLTVYDKEMAALNGGIGNYAGAKLTLVRGGGAHPEDYFAASGNLRFADGQAYLGQVNIGSVKQDAGRLELSFNANATQVRVDRALASLAYMNLDGGASSGDFSIDWSFSDGNRGDQGAGGAGLAQFQTTVHYTGADIPYWINALLWQKNNENDAARSRAYYLDAVGTDRTFNVVFPAEGLDRYFPDKASQLRQLSAEEQARVWSGLKYLSSFADLQFVPGKAAAGSDTLVMIGATSNNGGQTHGLGDNGAFAWFGFPRLLQDGAVDVKSMLHEVGHMLGMKHPMATEAEWGPYLPVDEQLTTWSVMNYMDSRPNETRQELRYGPLDIATLQYLYGPNPAARSGNDVYALRADAPNFIWDGAGVDTISATGLKQGVTVHLDPGHWDFIGERGAGITASGQVTVNFGSVIENLIGGEGDDSLFGSAAGNRIAGGAGNDRIDGGAGTDTAVFSGGAFDYELLADAGGWRVRDRVAGRDGTDTLTGIELLRFADLEVSPAQLQAYAAYERSGPFQNPGDDVFRPAAGNQRMDGGAGIDTIRYDGMRAAHALQRLGGAILVGDVSGNDLLLNIERVHFDDVSLAFDVDGHAGQVYRLYQAAFDRKPDLEGLGFWINARDTGASLESIAKQFIGGKEFGRLYGQSVDNAAFLTKVYNNILHRAPDQNGYDWWLNELNHGLSRERILVDFSEGQENALQVIGAIQNGFEYIPFLG